MPFAIVCACGQKLQLPDGPARGRVRCAKCGKPVAVAAQASSVPTVAIRVWTYPDLPWGDNLVVLTAGELYSDRIDREKLPEAQAKLLQGQPAAAVLGEEATCLRLQDLIEVKTHQHDEVVDVHYRDEDGKRAQHSCAFVDTKVRDEALNVLGQRLGWALVVKPTNALQASLWPAFTLGLIALFTFGFYVGAREMAAGNAVRVEGKSSRSLMASVLLWVVDLIGVWGVLLLGGLAMAGAGYWWYCRIRQPPIQMTLAPRDL